jgi:metal-responsive CopG/Arc/MetJ family transcriptional regulator
MKTAISLPDTLYEDAEKTAKSMGIPRSQLFAKALEEFISHHKKESITEKYNEIYSQLASKDISNIESISIINLRELTKNDTW